MNSITISAVTWEQFDQFTLSSVSITDNSKYLLPYQVGKLRSDLQCCNCDYVARPQLCPLSSSTVSRGVTSSRIRTHRQSCVTLPEGFLNFLYTSSGNITVMSSVIDLGKLRQSNHVQPFTSRPEGFLSYLEQTTTQLGTYKGRIMSITNRC